MKSANKKPIVKDNYLITKEIPRTPANLVLAGRGATIGIFENASSSTANAAILAEAKKIMYTKALWYLEAAAVLGQKEAPFFISFIYEEGGELMENEKLSKLWLAIGVDLEDERAIEYAEIREIKFDAETQRHASTYVHCMKLAAPIFSSDKIVRLKDVESAIEVWNTVDYHGITLTPHTMELAGECGALQEAPALMGDADQSCCIIM